MIFTSVFFVTVICLYNCNLSNSFSYSKYSIHNIEIIKNNIAIINKRGTLSSSQLIRKHNSQTLSSYSFLLTGFGSPIQEDLPNLFGINPVEGAIIFGILYYIYGPGTLYEYARDAGKFISTYGPIVKEVSFDIFYEFRDYLEEERQRDDLRKSGVDIDAIPRKTTNVIERFQESLKAFSEAANSNEDSKVLKSAFRNDDESSSISNDVVINDTNNFQEYESSSTNQSKVINKKRKTKKEVLNDRNVDIDEVKVATTNMLSSGTSIDFDKESLNTINTQINSLKSLNEEQNNIIADSFQADNNVNLYNTEGFYNFPQSSEVVANETPPIKKNLEQTLSLNKFQQQMSGEWNQRVLRRDKYSTTVPSNAFDDYYDDLSLSNEFNELKNADMYNENDEFLRNASFEEQSIMNNNVPSDLSILDLDNNIINKLNLDMLSTALSASSEPATIEGLSVLRELDKDYLVLRSKFLKYLEEQQNQLDQIKKNSLTVDFVDNIRNNIQVDDNKLASSVSNKIKYWPPLKAFQNKNKLLDF